MISLGASSAFLPQAARMKLRLAIRQSIDVDILFIDCFRSIHSANFIFYLALSLRLFSRDMVVVGEKSKWCPKKNGFLYAAHDWVNHSSKVFS
jgi:hypothetical protein